MNLYWVTTQDHDEDYFVASSMKDQAAQYFADGLGIFAKEISASRIGNIEVKGTDTRYVQLDELESLGFTVVHRSCPIVVRYKSRLFKFDLGMQIALVSEFHQANCVYMLQVCSSDRYKIGVTNNIRNRLKNIQTGNPDAIKIIALLECPKPTHIESSLHEEFACYRIHGEWFEMSSDVSFKVYQRMKELGDNVGSRFGSIGVGDRLGL